MKKAISGVLCTSLFLSGCASGGLQQHEIVREVPQAEIDAAMDGKSEAMRPFVRNLLAEGKRNAVLNNMKLGVAALEAGEVDVAAGAFDAALNGIEAVYAENPEAEKARSVWTKENIKDFKGEPYERAMAYYYRGLIYLMKDDYENARASFKGGMLQDSFAEDSRYRADYASFAFLEGWSNQCLGDKSAAKEKYDEAKSLSPSFEPPAPDDTLLIAVETGSGPRKLGVGKYKEVLTFNTGAAGNYGMRAGYSKNTKTLWRAEDVNWQATTRGGREVDGILEGKASFKDDTKTAGQVATAVGAATMAAAAQQNYYSGDNSASGAAAAGAAIMLIGLIAQASAEAMRAEADIREWDSLPGALNFATLNWNNLRPAPETPKLQAAAPPKKKGPAPAPIAPVTQPPVTADDLILTTFQGQKLLTENSKFHLAGGAKTCRIAWLPASRIDVSAAINAIVSEAAPAAPATPSQNTPESVPGGSCRLSNGNMSAFDASKCAAVGGTYQGS